MSHYTIEQALQHLRLPGMLAALLRQREDNKMQNIAFEKRLNLLIDAELHEKQNRKIATLLKNAKLRYVQATLEDVDYLERRQLNARLIDELASCDWIKNKHNVLLTGATGTGKSWLACALAKQACRMGMTVMYTTATSLFEGLRLAYADGSMLRYKRSLTKVQLLVIDDLGIGGIQNDLSPILLEILDQQSMVGSLMITSQYPKDKWYDLFGDPTVADAILDRVIYGSYEMELKGESMRKLKARK